NEIIAEIKEDFKIAYKGIIELPKEARFGVYLAYRYFSKLLKKIDKVPASTLRQKRIRVSNSSKTYLLFKSYVRYQFNIV
ncbi:MAG: phytoene/squalene synthase family protein, partial [Flavicella sp.]